MAEKLCQLKKKGGGSKDSNLLKTLVFRSTQSIIENNSNSLSFLATNSYNASYPSSQYPANWYIAGSNDLNNWNELLNLSYTTKNTNYNTQKTVDVSDYKYLKFGIGSDSQNYMTVARFENMQWS